MKLVRKWFSERSRLGRDGARILRRIAPLLPAPWSVAQLRPSFDESRAWPNAGAISAKEWDLSRRRAPAHVVLVAVGLDLMSDRARLQNVLASCRLLVALDRIDRARASDGERLLSAIILGDLELRIYRGDYTDPLLRVDDYPTGVRPIRADLRPLHDVLARIDRAAVPFHLGIVPGILDDSMFAFLQGLERLVPVQHGFDHGYPQYSRLLIEKNDPDNQRGTVGAFDEFAGRPYAEQLDQLRRGRDLLQARLSRRVTSYVPPTNTANRRTARALEALGFEYVLSERAIPGCRLPCIPSGFYGRSSELPPGPIPDVVTLHATWEADLAERGEDTLRGFLDALLQERKRRRDEVQRVAEHVAKRVGGA